MRGMALWRTVRPGAARNPLPPRPRLPGPDKEPVDRALEIATKRR